MSTKATNPTPTQKDLILKEMNALYPSLVDEMAPEIFKEKVVVWKGLSKENRDLFRIAALRAFNRAYDAVVSAPSIHLRSVFSGLIIQDLFVRQGAKGGYRAEMAVFSDQNATLYGLTLLTKRAEAVQLFSQKPYEFLDQIADLSFQLGGKKGITYHTRHPTYGRVFLEPLSVPLKEVEGGHSTTRVSAKTGLLKRRLEALAGRGDFPDDPVLGGAGSAGGGGYSKKSGQNVASSKSSNAQKVAIKDQAGNTNEVVKKRKLKAGSQGES